jgi:hypothetical protein
VKEKSRLVWPPHHTETLGSTTTQRCEEQKENATLQNAGNLLLGIVKNQSTLIEQHEFAFHGNSFFRAGLLPLFNFQPLQNETTTTTIRMTKRKPESDC